MKTDNKIRFSQVLAMPIGMLLLAVALLMQKFLPVNNFLDFIAGLFIGLSIAINIYYILIISRKFRRS